MYNSNKAENISEDLKQFIIKLIKDNEDRLEQIMQKKKDYMNEIYEKEAVIQTISQIEKQSSNLFSPNSKDYMTEDYYTELNNIKQKIIEIEKEEKKVNDHVCHLMGLKRAIINQENPHLNIGINILEIQEQDRQRIARDLHDSTVQNLTSLIHKCELCLRLIDMDPVRAKLELNTMSNTIKSVINEIREIIYNLKPMSLDDLGLITTIDRYISQLMMNHDIKINLTYNKEEHDILPVIKLSLFRMIQEACNNAIKHANAKTIDIDIEYEEKYIKASIADDGKGFEADGKKEHATSDYSGYGLSIMKERVYLLSGTMNIKSTLNKGTIVTISIPITKSGE